MDIDPGNRLDSVRLNAMSFSGKISPARDGAICRRSSKSSVTVRTEKLVLPTYLPHPPDRNPMFLEKRVYQGSSGRVYPLPFTDRIAEKPVAREWTAVWIENEFLRALVLPEIGGRIHRLLDKTNGYDAIYYQPVIKPALVGLAGPWISGGIEFNWPQHHRPATFLPVDFEIEAHADGSKTIWCSDHDPMCRMKGMHGVCLHPGKSYLELKVRACNRTPFRQTFLWWANVATRVHEGYQSFFPPDVYYVADHARRSMSEYPLAQGFYYGVNYGERGRKGVPANEAPGQFVPAHIHSASDVRCSMFDVPGYTPNDLSFYANIPTPCSYMCMGSKEDFFGGYDFFREAGLIHFASHHISPGKKQWTWGNHPFGYAWDRNLTDPDANGEYGPYIELMAGVYTDNQPDFSFLQPGETKSWSQFWFPIQKIGPARHANLDAALSLEESNSRARVGVCVTQNFPAATVQFIARGKSIANFTGNLTPGTPFLKKIRLPKNIRSTELQVRVLDRAGREIISHQLKPRVKGKVPPPAAEPPAPAEIKSADELFLTGLHLEQYRHATRCPTLYWREALRRDPLDSRCNNAVGVWHLRRGEFTIAEKHFRKSIARLTRRNANPADGEPFYNLGLCLRYQLSAIAPSPSANGYRRPAVFDDADAAFYKATWNQAWASAAYHALAELDCRRANWETALDHLDRSLRLNVDNLRARNLKAMVLRRLNRRAEAAAFVRETLALDPLDWWARSLSGQKLACDGQTAIDLAHDLAVAGFHVEAIALLSAFVAIHRRDNGKFALPDQSLGALPMIHFTLGWLHERAGDLNAALKAFRQAATIPPDCCFPARLEDISVLEAAMRANPNDARAPYCLGNFFFDRRRHVEAIRLWENSARLDPRFSVVWRNLGIGYFNILKKPAKARAAYDRAFKANPRDARLLYERDQLWKRLRENPARRLRALEKHPRLVSQRDDLSVELCALLNQTGRHREALRLLADRHFQPWEGGEGGPLGQYVRANLALGRQALRASHGRSPIADRQLAAGYFQAAFTAPPNLGEAKHLLANQSDLHYWAGMAAAFLGDETKATGHWLEAATFKGDFQSMSVRAFSEMTFYSALSWERLEKTAKAKRLLRELLAYAQDLLRTPAKIDYFATSLPTMLLFDDDLQFRQETTALFLQAQARLGLGNRPEARGLLQKVLRRDPNHALAADLFDEHFQEKGRS
jgi:tetratricopeptide (TPR) repeat protein